MLGEGCVSQKGPSTMSTVCLLPNRAAPFKLRKKILLVVLSITVFGDQNSGFSYLGLSLQWQREGQYSSQVSLQERAPSQQGAKLGARSKTALLGQGVVGGATPRLLHPPGAAGRKSRKVVNWG